MSNIRCRIVDQQQHQGNNKGDKRLSMYYIDIEGRWKENKVSLNSELSSKQTIRSRHILDLVRQATLRDSRQLSDAWDPLRELAM